MVGEPSPDRHSWLGLKICVRSGVQYKPHPKRVIHLILLVYCAIAHAGQHTVLSIQYIAFKYNTKSRSSLCVTMIVTKLENEVDFPSRLRRRRRVGRRDRLASHAVRLLLTYNRKATAFGCHHLLPEPPCHAEAASAGSPQLHQAEAGVLLPGCPHEDRMGSVHPEPGKCAPHVFWWPVADCC